MRVSMNSLARRSAAVVVALAFFAGLAQASITLTTIPESPIPNGQTAAIAAKIESSKTIAKVYLQYRFRDARDIAADPDTPWSAWHDQVMFPGEGSEWAGYLPILPAGEINWCVCAEYTDGSSEGKAEATDALSYDYVHDMRASAELAGSCSTPTNGEDVVVADWGWRQDSDEPGGTNFFANAPGGGQWKAKGVGWAAGQNRKFRIPALGATSVKVGEGLSYPVLFFLNLDPAQKPYIRTPKLRSGVKTISFNAYNVAGTTSKLKVQISRASGEPDDESWQDVGDELELLEASKKYTLIREVNDPTITYVRILRTQKNTGSSSQYIGFIGIDDICVIPPEPTTQTTVVAGTLDYGRLHDMKGIPGLVTTSGDYYAEEYGWVQDISVGGKITSGTYKNTSTSTNFYAAAPNGSRWEASGVGWAAARGIASRLPHLGANALDMGDGLEYPVLFFFNLEPDLTPYIRTPKLDGGLGTFSFNAKNVVGTTSRLLVQVAYTDRTPGDGDWFDVEEYELTVSGTNYWFTNVLNDISVTYARILRTEKNTASSSHTTGVIGIDNICATPPTPDVDLYDGLRDPWNMNATNSTIVRCMVSNLLERTPAVNQKVTVHYALAWRNDKNYSVTNDFTTVTMTYAGETNGCSLYEGTIPAQGVAGWLYYYYRCDFEGYYYVSPEVNGMATPKYYGGFGSTNEAPTTVAATYLKGEVRVSRTRYSEVVLMRFVDGVRQEDRQMTLVDDDRWQVQVPVEKDTVVTAYFVGSGGYGDEGAGTRWFYGDKDQDEPYDTPTGGTPDRQYSASDNPGGITNSLPGMVIESDSDGYLVYRLDDSDIDENLRYTIRRGVFQDFDDWQEEGRYYVESLYGTGVSEQKEDFIFGTGVGEQDGVWVEPYGWSSISEKSENFARVSPTNSDYKVYGDRIPDENKDEFNWRNKKTPEGWYVSGFRLTNARVADTNVVYTYGGCSNVLAQIRSGGRFFNADPSLSEGVDEVVARMRSSVIDGAKALYFGSDPDNPKTWSYGDENSPLVISTSFSIPTKDRADSHYYASLVFDYQDERNYHELRFTRGDATSGSSSDNRLRLELVEVHDGDERKAVHQTPYDSGNVNNAVTNKFKATIKKNGTTLTVNLSELGNLPNGWSSISLTGCSLASDGQIGFGAYECAPKFDYITISGNNVLTPYAAGSDAASSSIVSKRFSSPAVRGEWSLGGSDYTASASGAATKWYFDSGSSYALRRRVPNMKVTLKAGADPFELDVSEVISIPTLDYVNYSKPFHSWAPLYVEFAVGGGDGNCVVFDRAAVTPWRGGTRKWDIHENGDSFGWTTEKEQNDTASSNIDGDYRNSWLVFEGWVVTNGLPKSDYVSGAAARFQRSQANPALAQALYSPYMTNGIGTVKFNYHITGEAGDSLTYAVEYTTKDLSGNFGDGSSYRTAAVYTNRIAYGEVEDYGYRSCNVCTNYLYDENGDIIPMRFRIRVLDEGTRPDAVLWIDEAYANDYPEEKDTMWKVYNGRLASSADSMEYEHIYGRSGRTLYLNNSNHEDTGEARGMENPFDEWWPYVQAPFMESGIGEVAFHYCALSNNTAHVGKLAVAISADKEYWEPILSTNVVGTGYIQFDDESIFQKTNHYIRFYTETNEAGRVCIDNILVMEPSRPGYDITTVILAPEQPIYSPNADVAVTVAIGRLTQNPQNIRLFASWVEGTNNWGYSNWWPEDLKPTPEHSRNTIELVQSGTNSQVFVSQEGMGLPASPANGTIQYVVWGIHDKIPENYDYNDVIFQGDGTFSNPPWYGVENLNDSMTNGSAKATFSPYYFIYSCPPGSVWINEVWNNYNTSTRKYYPDNSPSYEFIELCGRAGTDISGWRLNIYLKGRSINEYEIDLSYEDQASYQIGDGAFLKDPDGDGWGFYVIGDEETPNVDYELDGKEGNRIDAFKATTIAFELMRSGGESGILECACYVGNASADPLNPNAEYAQRISIPTKSSTNAGYSYSLLDDYTHVDNPVYSNKVADTGWYWALGWPTPGAINRSMANVQNQSFAGAVAAYFNFGSLIDASAAYGTQNGGRNLIYTQLENGAATSVVYKADSFHRIVSLTSNDVEIAAAAGKSIYTFTIDAIRSDINNLVAFGPKPGWTEDMIAWAKAHNWSEADIDAGDDDKYSVAEEYLMDTDPTAYTEVDARTTAITLGEGDGGAVAVDLGLRLYRADGGKEVTSALNGVVNVYGMSELGGDETKVSSLGGTSFSGTTEASASFTLTGDAAGLRFFKWKIE